MNSSEWTCRISSVHSGLHKEKNVSWQLALIEIFTGGFSRQGDECVSSEVKLTFGGKEVFFIHVNHLETFANAFGDILIRFSGIGLQFSLLYKFNKICQYILYSMNNSASVLCNKWKNNIDIMFIMGLYSMSDHLILPTFYPTRWSNGKMFVSSVCELCFLPHAWTCIMTWRYGFLHFSKNLSLLWMFQLSKDLSSVSDDSLSQSY